MGKDSFLTYFQENLRIELEELIKMKWGFSDITIKCEDRNIPGKF